MAAKTGPNGLPVADWAPATKQVAITKSDSTDLTASLIRALWVGGAGDVAVLALNDTAAVLISGVPAGTVLPVCPIKVMSSGTTATLIVGWS